MSADQENTKNPQSPEINEPRLEAEKKQTETKTDTKTELSSLRTSVEGQKASTETAGDLTAPVEETPTQAEKLDPKRNIIRTVDYTEPARWFDPQTKPSNYPPDYFVQKNYNGEIPKRYEDTISSEELTRMRDQGEYVEKMSYPNSVEYYKTIMGGIPPNSEWIIGNADFFGQKVRTNIVLAIALKELEHRLKNLPGGKKLNPRFNTLTSYNPGKEKHHGLAMAIDFDPKENWVEKASETKWNIPMAMVLEAQKMGFDWGMYYFEGRADRTTDAMHFAYRGRIPSLMKSLKSAEAIQMAKSFSVPGENKSLYEFDDTKYENLTEGGGSDGKIDTKKLEEEEKIISELASKYDIEVKKLKEKPEQLRSILGEADILEIRSNAKILFQKLYPNQNATESQIIEAETTRRISAYTEGEATDFGWYTLNYKQVNESHEMQVGLGEILLDPSIKEIEVIRAGRKIKGQRGTKSGRVCFLDENGNYIATYTGDKFRIISKEIIAEKENETKILEENSNRTNYKQLTQQSQNSPDFAAEVETKENWKKNPNLLYLPNYDLNDAEIIKLKEITPSTGKMSPKEFFDKHLEIAKYISKKFNLPISVCLAQAALESGWGGSRMAMNTNAYFGIKGGRGMVFKQYSNVFDSFYHYGELIQKPRYQNKIKEKNIQSKKEFDKYIVAIGEAGYAAGSPTYAQKVINIINTHNLSRFD